MAIKGFETQNGVEKYDYSFLEGAPDIQGMIDEAIGGITVPDVPEDIEQRLGQVETGLSGHTSNTTTAHGIDTAIPAAVQAYLDGIDISQYITLDAKSIMKTLSQVDIPIEGDDGSYLSIPLELGGTGGTDYSEAAEGLDVISARGTVAMKRDLKMGGKKIVNLADPEADADAVTKSYVDGLLAQAASSTLSLTTHNSAMELLWSNDVLAPVASNELIYENPIYQAALFICYDGIGSRHVIVTGRFPSELSYINRDKQYCSRTFTFTNDGDQVVFAWGEGSREGNIDNNVLIPIEVWGLQ